MDTDALIGRSILVVEDRPIVALQLEAQLHAAGARVYSAARLEEALHMAEHPALSAAVIDLYPGGESSVALCRRLRDHGIPFVFYAASGQDEALHDWPDAPVVLRPVGEGALVHAVADLLH